MASQHGLPPHGLLPAGDGRLTASKTTTVVTTLGWQPQQQPQQQLAFKSLRDSLLAASAETQSTSAAAAATANDLNAARNRVAGLEKSLKEKSLEVRGCCAAGGKNPSVSIPSMSRRPTRASHARRAPQLAYTKQELEQGRKSHADVQKAVACATVELRALEAAEKDIDNKLQSSAWVLLARERGGRAPRGVCER